MKNPTIYIRYGTDIDNRLLAELGAHTFQDAFGAENTPEDMAAYLAAEFTPEKQATELADPSSVFLIAEIEGRALGFARLKEGQSAPEIRGLRAIEIVRIYTSREWIGHGIGAILMKACLSEAEKRACDTIWLGVWERNLRARAFYRKWGFEEAGTHLFRLGDDLQTDRLMQRPVKMP